MDIFWGRKQKAKISKWDCIKLKISSQQKQLSTKWKNNSPNGTFINHVSDKGVVSKIYENLIQLNNKKNSQLKKWVKKPNRHFSKLVPPKQAKKQTNKTNNKTTTKK